MSRFCLALVEADEVCKREVARRLHGDLLTLSISQTDSEHWLSQAQAVGWLGSDVNWNDVQRCLKANKHLLISSNACQSKELLRSIFQAVDCADAWIEIGNSIASLPSRDLVWRQYQSGTLGEPGLVRVHRWCSSSRPPTAREHSRSAILLNEISNTLRFFEQAPQRVFASAYPGQRGYVIHLAWKNEAMAIIDFVYQLSSPSGYASFSVIGSRGSAYADDHQNTQLIFPSSPLDMTVQDYVSPECHMLMAFLARLRNLKEKPEHASLLNRESLRNWEQSLSVADAAQESLKTGRSVEPTYEFEDSEIG